MNIRRSGILFHISSLPSPYGIGDLGPKAREFATMMADAGQGIWQMLPLVPTDPEMSNSPYSSISAFAGNPLFISPEDLLGKGLITHADMPSQVDFDPQKAEYEKAARVREPMLDAACRRMKGNASLTRRFKAFCTKHKAWLDDFALFEVLTRKYRPAIWHEWPKEARDRHPATMRALRKEHAQEIEKNCFVQFLFFDQWTALKKLCNKKGILLFGDMPLYVNYNSTDVWSHPQIYQLDKNKNPKFVAGVPPDYFSEFGQLWGNPVYDWKELQRTKFGWWIHRLEHCLSLFDIVRIDHFRGLVGYWRVKFGEKTAVKGKWAKAPATEFLGTAIKKLGAQRIIGEDLGTITKDVEKAMTDFHIPGMKVLLFAFGDVDPENPYLPHNYPENCVVYTGTHDNNTTRGWFAKEAGDKERQHAAEYLGAHVTEQNVAWHLIRSAMRSTARTAVISAQDLLDLGPESRMNTPGTSANNWQWRIPSLDVLKWPLEKLGKLTGLYGRALKPRKKSRSS